MKRTSLVATAIALSIGLSNVTFAQGGPRGDDRNDQRRGDRSDNRGNDNRGGDNRGGDNRNQNRNDNRGGARNDSHRGPVYQAPPPRRGVVREEPGWNSRDPRWNQKWSRGAGPGRDLYRGGRLPPRYHSNVYVVDNWQGHNLRRPPAGYHWVQTGGDYVLAAIATGIILSIILDH